MSVPLALFLHCQENLNCEPLKSLNEYVYQQRQQQLKADTLSGNNFYILIRTDIPKLPTILRGRFSELVAVKL